MNLATGILVEHPLAVAWGQSVCAVVALLSFIWASRYIRSDEYPPERPKQGTVLLVEDDLMLGRMAQALLNSEGIDVRRAATLGEALPIGENETVLITDWMLPDSSGADVILAFHAAHPGRPVIVASGMSHPPFDLPPFVTWVGKPFDPDQLITVVRRMVRG